MLGTGLPPQSTWPPGVFPHGHALVCSTLPRPSGRFRHSLVVLAPVSAAPVPTENTHTHTRLWMQDDAAAAGGAWQCPGQLAVQGSRERVLQRGLMLPRVPGSGIRTDSRVDRAHMCVSTRAAEHHAGCPHTWHPTAAAPAPTVLHGGQCVITAVTPAPHSPAPCSGTRESSREQRLPPMADPAGAPGLALAAVDKRARNQRLGLSFLPASLFWSSVFWKNLQRALGTWRCPKVQATAHGHRCSWDRPGMNSRTRCKAGVKWVNM